MTLLITVFAAIAATIVWYLTADKCKLHLGKLALFYWGASLMWLCDAIFEYAKLGAEYFTPAVSDMINDTFLGLSAVALGLIIWLAIVIISDPKKVFKHN